MVIEWDIESRLGQPAGYWNTTFLQLLDGNQKSLTASVFLSFPHAAGESCIEAPAFVASVVNLWLIFWLQDYHNIAFPTYPIHAYVLNKFLCKKNKNPISNLTWDLTQLKKAHIHKNPGIRSQTGKHI